MASAEAWSGVHCPFRGMLVLASPSRHPVDLGCRPTDVVEGPGGRNSLGCSGEQVAARLDTRYQIGRSNGMVVKPPQGQRFSPKPVLSASG